MNGPEQIKVFFKIGTKLEMIAAEARISVSDETSSPVSQYFA
jgi:hypothetical protein